MSAAGGDFRIGAQLESAAYLLDAAAAHAYGAALDSPPRRNPRRGIHDDQEAARRAGFTAPIAAGEQTIAVIAQFLADRFGDRFIRGGRLEVSLTRPVLYGDTLKSFARIESVNGKRAELRIRVENQRGESVLTGTAEVGTGKARTTQP